LALNMSILVFLVVLSIWKAKLSRKIAFDF
jgi:hypothetical protein